MHGPGGSTTQETSWASVTARELVCSKRFYFCICVHFNNRKLLVNISNSQINSFHQVVISVNEKAKRTKKKAVKRNINLHPSFDPQNVSYWTHSSSYPRYTPRIPSPGDHFVGIVILVQLSN